jgi:hypothetical protein
MTNQLKEELLQYQWLVLLFVVLGIRNFDFKTIHLQKENNREYQKQYQLN